ncbi:MAG TPA: hypothetical protein VF111_11615, partial [Thermoanaerobaculia bacterium]
LVASAGISQSVLAQEEIIYVNATPFHRFITQNETLGNFLTANFSEGSCCPYNYRYEPFPYQADIVPVVPGYVPRQDQGLAAVHAWQVDERPRIYYYYSIFYAPHGSNYRYLGVVGYAMARDDPRGTPFHYWYSQYYGYYYTLSGEYPPWGTFAYHGTSWRLPVGGTFIFEKIPVIEDPCGPDAELRRQECEMNPNSRWNPDTCTCEPFFCRFCDQPVY